MVNSIDNVSSVIYLSHLEEASFLYEQRLGLFDDPELTWLDLDDFEERYEAHIDALVLGEDLALAVCRQQAAEGDAGELHAAVCVFCRQDRLDLVTEAIEEMDPEDDERVQAVRDALADEMPDSWLAPLTQKLRDEGGVYTRLLPYALGFRHRPANELLVETLAENPIDSGRALGRLRDKQAARALLNLLHDGDADVQREASLALMRTGDEQVISQIQSKSEPWSMLHLGLCGNAGQVTPLMQRMAATAPVSEGLLALGLLGDPAAVPLLMLHLEHEDVAQAASFALYLITGAQLFEETFEPEEIDEDMLFDDELEKLKNGEPLYEPGEEPGIRYTRISQDREHWKAWWEQNKATFTVGIPYRNSKPYEPVGLLEMLKSEHTPNALRRLIYEELVIRYGIDAPFEVEKRVRAQVKAIGELESQVQDSAFTPGKWYYAGRLV